MVTPIPPKVVLDDEGLSVPMRDYLEWAILGPEGREAEGLPRDEAGYARVSGFRIPELRAWAADDRWLAAYHAELGERMVRPAAREVALDAMERAAADGDWRAGKALMEEQQRLRPVEPERAAGIFEAVSLMSDEELDGFLSRYRDGGL